MTLKNISYKDVELKNFSVINSVEAELVREWRNNPLIEKWMYSSHKITKAEHRIFLDKLKIDKENIYWLGKIKGTGYAGVVYLNRIDKKNKNVFLGIYANPDKNVPGTGRKLIKCLQYVVFNKLKLHSLKLEVISGNNHALRFYVKAGFKIEGLLKDFKKKNGKWLDVVIMGKKNDFQN